ncbi:DUF418 domain-containing protein [Staphylococcus argensis]|uniref:DUF418 domain-containing protein n=1 Tax=Staphylococcus argensis TaxID=1607738 RepID=A0A2K4FAW0_9STAP|nr:DUF418 domain-containing protein [Staphylococcus argensis]MCY6992094.1 DUF418 domain-containing protein [Staphylococcus argensis]POA08416.1 hypothetical protein CD039_10055 [Staphylococcus argensis]
MTSKRIIALDIIRGFAICIVAFANLQDAIPIMSGVMPKETHLDHIINVVKLVAIDSKFISIFTILFGVGMAIFMCNAESKDLNPIKLMFRRLIFLFIVGIPLFIFGVPFTIYAVVGLIVMFGFKLKPRWLLLAVAVIALAGYFISLETRFNQTGMPPTFSLMLIGYYLGMSGKIYNFKASQSTYWGLLVSLFGLAVTISLYFALPMKWNDLLAYMTPFQAIAYFILLFILLKSDLMKNVLMPFKYVGRMAFTIFTLQIILIEILGRVTGHLMGIQIIIYGVPLIMLQLVISYLWLRYFRQGPLEKLWRMWTYKNV